jgi:exopolyphosphatase/guanosine-5'-triphosphate,3'-diphosphate pyrophosphatase
VEDVLARLAALPEAERRGVPGLHPDRVGVIVAGTAILAAVLDALGTAEMMVSERDLLDGVAMAPAPPGQPVT